MLTVHADSDWIRPFVPNRFKLRYSVELSDTSRGWLAARCFWNSPPTATEEIQSLSNRYDHVVVYMCEPWERRLPSDMLPRTLADCPANVMLFSDVIMDQPYDNYRQISNWFMCHDSLYQISPWAQDLLAKLRHDYDVKQYRFDALLGVKRDTKEAVYQRWRNSAVQSSILLTYHKNDARTGIWEVPYTATAVEWPDREELDESCLTTTLWSYMPMGDDPAYVHRVGTQNIIPTSIYNSCWYSIIAEGFSDSRGTRLTEKTAKCLVSQRLFVMFGAPHDLRRLRTLGFRTFDGIIDESYDSIEDYEQRWTKAWQQVEYLCAQDPVKIQAATREIRQHNQRVFLETDWFANLRNHIRDLADKYS